MRSSDHEIDTEKMLLESSPCKQAFKEENNFQAEPAVQIKKID